jgi:hypothetical protein
VDQRKASLIGHAFGVAAKRGVNMDWLVGGISGEPDLTSWEQRPFSATVEQGPHVRDNRDNHQRIMGRESPGLPESNGIAQRLADAILRFDVFPPTLVQSVLRRTPIETGDVIGVRYPFLPGIHLFFAARVYERFEDVTEQQWRCGFSYRTLAGHPECGEETFLVEKNLANGQVVAALRSWSRPGIWLATLGYPMVRMLQVRAGRRALDHLESVAHAR